jgi:asparagine synthetase B (glutamine-hydrolysing)
MLVDLIRAAIADRVDAGTGVTLSGGLDSSTVSILAPRPLVAFTGYYAEPGHDERRYARLAARGPHHEILITPEQFVEHFDDMAHALRYPINQTMGAFGQYMVARYASRYVDSVVSGEGSDELFGGYARTLLAAGEPMPEGYEHYRPPADYPVNDLAAALAYDLERLPVLLSMDEQTTAPFGIDSRSPFTDQRIVDYALALDPRERVGKRHLRAAVRGIVPDAIIDRRDKMGFPIPLVRWAQSEPVRSFVRGRIGYVPDISDPYDRGWWHQLIAATKGGDEAVA